MPSTEFVFSLQNVSHGWWEATFTNGANDVTIKASYVPSEPLLPLLWAVRRLLQGLDNAECSWWAEPGEHRWLFSRQGEQLQIHIVWFDDFSHRPDEHGETVLKIEYDLLNFAKRLYHQLGQISYQDKKTSVPTKDYQNLQEDIIALSHARHRSTQG